jgi:hypothetical protein
MTQLRRQRSIKIFPELSQLNPNFELVHLGWRAVNFDSERPSRPDPGTLTVSSQWRSGLRPATMINCTILSLLAAPLETERLIQADQPVGGAVIDETAVPKKVSTRSLCGCSGGISNRTRARSPAWHAIDICQLHG